MSRDLLLEELDFVSSTVLRLIDKIEPHHLEFQPPHMRNLKDLLNHLVQIPAVDILILKEASQEEVQQLEASLQSSVLVELTEMYRRSIQQLKDYYIGLSDDEYKNNISTAFYGASHSQEKWLLDVVTHTYHHRAQLFSYLKMSGVDIDMFILY